MQNEKSGKLDKFFAGKGFYIVLALCVIVIGISAYSLVKGADDTGVGLDPGISAARQTERPKPSAEPPVAPKSRSRWMLRARLTSFRPERLLRTSVWPEQVTWRWPVSGDIERGYSVEALSYDVTMADWCTPDGVDILAQQGEVAVAAGDGDVVSVTQDDLYGTTVVIDHGSGIKTQYSNLADTPTVSPGDKVKGGDSDGSVGKRPYAR
ncbi:MAG: M23 family metallopeptidase [Oscillospiraceae bacterium]